MRKLHRFSIGRSGGLTVCTLASIVVVTAPAVPATAKGFQPGEASGGATWSPPFPSLGAIRPLAAEAEWAGQLPAMEPLEEPGSTAARARSNSFQSNRTYDGVMRTEVHYYDACGSDLGVRTTQIAAEVGIGPPLRLDESRPSETNPLNLSVAARTSGNDLGYVSLQSALVVTPPTPPDVIVQYWNLALQKGRLTGTLVEDHGEEGVAFNFLVADKEIVPCQPQLTSGFPYPLPENTTLEGSVTPDAIRLRTGARISDPTMTLEFVSDVIAERSQ